MGFKKKLEIQKRQKEKIKLCKYNKKYFMKLKFYIRINIKLNEKNFN